MNDKSERVREDNRKGAPVNERAVNYVNVCALNIIYLSPPPPPLHQGGRVLRFSVELHSATTKRTSIAEEVLNATRGIRVSSSARWQMNGGKN